MFLAIGTIHAEGEKIRRIPMLEGALAIRLERGIYACLDRKIWKIGRDCGQDV